MTSPFQTTAGSGFTDTSFSAAKLYARSTSPSDSTTITISGLDENGDFSVETLTLDGKIEQQTSNQYTKIVSVGLGGAAAGAVTVYAAGQAATGVMYLTDNPSEGDTVTVGPVGDTTTYTFGPLADTIAETSITCKAVADLSQSGYFDIAFGGATHRFWYDIDSNGTAPDLTDVTGHAISVATGNDAHAVWTATGPVINAVDGFTCGTIHAPEATPSTLTVTSETEGEMVVTDGPGDALGTITVVSTGTGGSPYEIAIGASVNDTASNFEKAINGDGTEGVNYGAGTAASTYFDAAVAGAVVTLTDKVACERKVGWSATRSGTYVNAVAPYSGEDGEEKVTLISGVTGIFGTVSLDDESLANDSLPGPISWTSNAVKVGGKPFSIHVAASNVTTPMACEYEYSTQTGTPTVWRTEGRATIAALDNNEQIVTPSHYAEYVRLKITNTNSAPASVNAKAVYPA